MAAAGSRSGGDWTCCELRTAEAHHSKPALHEEHLHHAYTFILPCGGHLTRECAQELPILYSGQISQILCGASTVPQYLPEASYGNYRTQTYHSFLGVPIHAYTKA